MTGIRVPGSSANLGPGFDVLGVAIGRHVWAFDEEGGELCGIEPAAPDHIARLAFERAGGVGEMWFGSELRPGRGLGFSAAARAAGAVLARRQRGDDIEQARSSAYPLVAELEGHGDNAAPSLYGGITIAAGLLPHRITARLPGVLVCWIPPIETMTDASRLELPAEVSRGDAVFNVGRMGLLMAALYEGKPSLLRAATEDRLHQPSRLTQCSPAREAIEAALDLGAHAAWLSGSGPTVAILVDDASLDAVVDGLAPSGEILRVEVDGEGAVEVDRSNVLPGL